jgi:hypothetical protein
MKWKRQTADDLRDHYRAIFGSGCGPAGHAIFLDLFEKSGMARTNFVPGEPDLSSFNDGCRSLFLHILQMAYEPGQVVEKIQETSATEYIDE